MRRLAGCEVAVIPTLGQHRPHTRGGKPLDVRGDPARADLSRTTGGRACTRVGTIPAAMVAETTGGVADWEIPLDLNTKLMTEPWDLVINIGHVVPHEVLGFANHNKNYFIGLGGKETICASHIAAAVYGIENNLGCLITPLRACFNWAEEEVSRASAGCVSADRDAAGCRGEAGARAASMSATIWRRI